MSEGGWLSVSTHVHVHPPRRGADTWTYALVRTCWSPGGNSISNEVMAGEILLPPETELREATGRILAHVAERVLAS